MTNPNPHEKDSLTTKPPTMKPWNEGCISIRTLVQEEMLELMQSSRYPIRQPICPALSR